MDQTSYPRRPSSYQPFLSLMWGNHGTAADAVAERFDWAPLEALEARYRRWRQLLDDGIHPNQAALARAERVSRAAVTLGLRRLQAAERAAEADSAGSPLRSAL